MFNDEQQEMIETAAEMLYGLIHARYILTTRGLSQMGDKFKHHEFGRCPRVFCNGQAVLPVGQSDMPRTSTVKVFCPKCEEIYNPRSAPPSPHRWRLLWHHLCPSVVPDLSGAYAVAADAELRAADLRLQDPPVVEGTDFGG